MQQRWNRIVAKAAEEAAKAHNNQFRKGSDIPYIVHPFEVAMILQENGLDDKIIAAGLLHDTLEDTSLTESDIEGKFGRDISLLVKGASEELIDRDRTLWVKRKKHTIEYLKNAPIEVKYIACADKLSNINSMIRNYQKVGEKLWDRFMNNDQKIDGRVYSTAVKREKQKWYYQGLIESLKELTGIKMYEEFKQSVAELFS